MLCATKASSSEGWGAGVVITASASGVAGGRSGLPVVEKIEVSDSTRSG
jgi:hypothetical protein